MGAYLAQFSFLLLLLRKRLSDSLDVVEEVLVSFKLLVVVGEGSKVGSWMAEGLRERSVGVVKPLLGGDELAGDVGAEADSLREEEVLETALRKRSLRGIAVVVLDDKGEVRVFIELSSEGDEVNGQALRLGLYGFQH